MLGKRQTAGESQGEFVPLAPYVPDIGQPLPEEKAPEQFSTPPQQKKRPRRKKALFWAALFLVVLALAGLAVKQKLDFNALLGSMQRGTFFEGVYINGVPVGGLTIEQARDMLSPVSKQFSSDLMVDIGGSVFRLSSQDLGLKEHLDDTLLEAFTIGRRNTGDSGGASPFAQRLREVRLAKESGAYFYSKVAYDPRKVQKAASQLAGLYQVPAKDASILGYNKDSGEVITSSEENGLMVDEEALYLAMVAALDEGGLSTPIKITPIVSVPKVTQVELRNRFSCLASFELKIQNPEDVTDFCQKINGLSIQPRQSFSFNQHLGSYEKEEAASELATVLMHGGLRAGLTLKERWPSDTIPKNIEAGLEARVSYGQKDLVLQNPRMNPVFLVFEVKKAKLECMVLGTKDDSGLVLHLEAELERLIPCDTMPVYRQNTQLEKGQKKRVSLPVDGKVVNTYLVKTRGDTAIERQLIYISQYEPVRAVVEYH